MRSESKNMYVVQLLPAPTYHSIFAELPDLSGNNMLVVNQHRPAQLILCSRCTQKLFPQIPFKTEYVALPKAIQMINADLSSYPFVFFAVAVSEFLNLKEGNGAVGRRRQYVIGPNFHSSSSCKTILLFHD